MSVRLRQARRSDSAKLLAWRNDPGTYRYFFSPKPVTRAEHAAWFASRLSDARTRLFIVEEGRKPVGQVRLDLGARRTAELSLSISPEARGRGLGTAAITAGAKRARRLGASKVVARVAADNVGSAVSFLKAGFRFEKVVDCGHRPAYLLGRPS